MKTLHDLKQQIDTAIDFIDKGFTPWNEEKALFMNCARILSRLIEKWPEDEPEYYRVDGGFEERQGAVSYNQALLKLHYILEESITQLNRP